MCPPYKKLWELVCYLIYSSTLWCVGGALSLSVSSFLNGMISDKQFMRIISFDSSQSSLVNMPTTNLHLLISDDWMNRCLRV